MVFWFSTNDCALSVKCHLFHSEINQLQSCEQLCSWVVKRVFESAGMPVLSACVSSCMCVYVCVCVCMCVCVHVFHSCVTLLQGSDLRCAQYFPSPSLDSSFPRKQATLHLLSPWLHQALFPCLVDQARVSLATLSPGLSASHSSTVQVLKITASFVSVRGGGDVCIWVCLCVSVCVHVCICLCVCGCLSSWMSVCLSVYLSVCVQFVSVCLSVYSMHVSLSVYSMSVCLSVCLYTVCMSVCVQFVCLFWMSAWLSECLSFCMSVEAG